MLSWLFGKTPEIEYVQREIEDGFVLILDEQQAREQVAYELNRFNALYNKLYSRYVQSVSQAIEERQFDVSEGFQNTPQAKAFNFGVSKLIDKYGFKHRQVERDLRRGVKEAIELQKENRRNNRVVGS